MRDLRDGECAQCGGNLTAGHVCSPLSVAVKIPTPIEFLDMLPAIREAARKLGYAVGLHGTLARDFDLIACPWTEEASHPDDVAEAIKEAAGCVRWRVYRGQGCLSRRNQDDKPHGRLTYAFDWDHKNYDNRGYIDLSVMPRQSNCGSEEDW